MGIMIKRLLLASAVLLSAFIAIPHADAAPKSVSCKASTAVGHSPMKLEIPKIKKPFKNKTFTFKTNCGEIVVEIGRAHV